MQDVGDIQSSALPLSDELQKLNCCRQVAPDDKHRNAICASVIVSLIVNDQRGDNGECVGKGPLTPLKTMKFRNWQLLASSSSVR